VHSRWFCRRESVQRTTVNPNSYDLTIGPYIARYREGFGDQKLLVFDPTIRLEEHTGQDIFEIEDHRPDGDFTLAAGESVLCHTNEFIGGTGLSMAEDATRVINTQMRATSTAGRYGLTACRCAGHGDPGYFDRWTLEVQNNAPFPVTIPIGSIICQLVFFAASRPLRLYQDSTGNYQSERDLNKLMASWVPERMLPKKLKTTSFWKELY
jgi:dCTP deaminase